MNKIVLSIAAGAAVLSIALPSFAQAPLAELANQFRQEREMLREQIKNIPSIPPETMRESLRAKREELQNLMKSQREEFRNVVETKREEIKQEVSAKREELVTRIRAFKGEQRETIMVRIYDNVNTLNERMTEHYLARLEQIDKVLANVESRIDKAAADGQEVSAVRSAVAAADSVIATAREAVQTQTTKAYAVTVNTSSTMKQDVQAVRQALHDDLSVVKNAVQAAHQAVRQAAVTLAQVPGAGRPAATSTSPATSTP